MSSDAIEQLRQELKDAREIGQKYEDRWFSTLAELEQEKGRHATSRDLAESAIARNCEEIDRQRREIEELRTKYAKLQEYVREGGDEPCAEGPLNQSSDQTLPTQSDNGPVTSKPEAGPEALARQFHETYERLAPQFGYETRKESAVPWGSVPEKNKKLMIAVCAELDRATATLRARVSEQQEQLRDILTKDSVKTREINILTQENNTLRKERDQLSAAWQQCREALYAIMECYAVPETGNAKSVRLCHEAVALTPAAALAEHDRELRQEVERLKGELAGLQKDRADQVRRKQVTAEHCKDYKAEADHLRAVLANLLKAAKAASPAHVWDIARQYYQRSTPLEAGDVITTYHDAICQQHEAAIQAAQEAIGQQP